MLKPHLKLVNLIALDNKILKQMAYVKMILFSLSSLSESFLMQVWRRMKQWKKLDHQEKRKKIHCGVWTFKRNALNSFQQLRCDESAKDLLKHFWFHHQL